MSLRDFFAPDGARIAFRDEGDGPPVLALSGLTRTLDDFDFIAPALAGVRLIRMDYRGRGRSSFTGAGTYTIIQEAADALGLLDHLGVARAAVLGTSRGGLIGMWLAATAKDRLLGLCLNDVGPELDREGLARIGGYLGRNPAARTLDEAAEKLPVWNPGFTNVPTARWRAHAARLYDEVPEGLRIRYDPALREAFLTSIASMPPDAWPLFDACAGLPIALIRGSNSDLLSAATVSEMRRRRPDLAFAEVPERAHAPFLDEPESLGVVRAWLAAIQ